MLLNSIPSPESSFGTLRMLLAKTIACKSTHHGYLGFILDPEENPLSATSPRLGDLSLGTAPGKIPF